MATQHEDFEGMRSGIDFAGPTLVHHGHHLGDPGPQHPDNVVARQDYADHIGGPTAARTTMNVHYQGSSPKVYMQTPSKRTWMLKPYHENLKGLEHLAHYPMLGWSELTTQGLYHAGGIGHLCQHSQATMHPVSQDEHQPFVAIAFHPDFKDTVDDLGNEYSKIQVRPAHMYDDAAKVAFMDFLTNQTDRHGANLLVAHPEDPAQQRLLAIDNALGFQYKVPQGHRQEFTDHLAHYFLDSWGISALAQSGMHPWDNQHVAHATDWWQNNGLFVREELDKHLRGIKDPSVRRHIQESFNDRADTLDRFSTAFSAAPEFDLYSPYNKVGEERARKVAEVKMRHHKPIYPWGGREEHEGPEEWE